MKSFLKNLTENEQLIIKTLLALGMQERELNESNVDAWKASQYSEYMRVYATHVFLDATEIAEVACDINGYENCFLNRHHLDSVIASIHTRYLYEAMPDQIFKTAAKIYVMITAAHAAVDGNKRTACASMFEFLRRNGAYEVKALPMEFADMLFLCTSTHSGIDTAITSISLQLVYSTYKLPCDSC